MSAWLKVLMAGVIKIIVRLISIINAVSGTMRFISYYTVIVDSVIKDVRNAVRRLSLRVKQLCEFLRDNLDAGLIKEDTNIIVVGGHNYGDFLGEPYIDNMSFINAQEVIEREVPVVAFSNSSYLFESDDLGYSRMWVDKQTLDEVEPYWNGKEEE